METRSFWIGILGGTLVAVLAVMFLVPSLGLFSMSARTDVDFLDWWGHTNWERSLAWRAPETALPQTASAESGLEHFRETCVTCHGAPGVEPAAWAKRMRPQPPDLTKEETREKTDGELFRVIDHGVRMSAMPAFGTEHDDAAIWDMVAAVRQLDELSPEQTESLRKAMESSGHGHGHEHRG